MSETGLPLRSFAERFYARAGVAPLLLDLQDRSGLDVLLLLGACWLGWRGVSLRCCDWPATAVWQQPWQVAVIEPLRAVRRHVQSTDGKTALYQQVKACELAAEWRQLEALAMYWSAIRADAPPGSTLQDQLLASCRAQGVELNDMLEGDLRRLAQRVPTLL